MGESGGAMRVSLAPKWLGVAGLLGVLHFVASYGSLKICEHFLFDGVAPDYVAPDYVRWCFASLKVLLAPVLWIVVLNHSGDGHFGPWTVAALCLANSLIWGIVISALMAALVRLACRPGLAGVLLAALILSGVASPQDQGESIGGLPAKLDLGSHALDSSARSGEPRCVTPALVPNQVWHSHRHLVRSRGPAQQSPLAEQADSRRER
jgi:hypothetical protein